MRLEDSLPSVLDELKKVVADVHELLGSENQTRIAKLVDELDATVLDLKGRFDPMAHDVHDVSERLSKSGEGIAEAAAGLRHDVTASVDSGVASLKAASKSIEGVTAKLSIVGDRLVQGTEGIDALVASLRGALARLDDTLGGTDVMVGDNRDVLRRTIGALRQSSRELEALLSGLKRDPSSLIFPGAGADARGVADKPVAWRTLNEERGGCGGRRGSRRRARASCHGAPSCATTCPSGPPAAEPSPDVRAAGDSLRPLKPLLRAASRLSGDRVAAGDVLAGAYRWQRGRSRPRW
jgi:hypothetical protein